MTKKRETQDVGEPVSDEVLDPYEGAISGDFVSLSGDDEPEEAPGEFPVLAHEPFYVPKGVKMNDILARLDALESAVFGKGKK